jgi:hypothetical protein
VYEVTDTPVSVYEVTKAHHIANGTHRNDYRNDYRNGYRT